MSGEELLVAITAAGATLKQAKTEKKSKAELQPLIESLLGLKAEYKAATGQDPPSAPKGPSKKDKKKKVEPEAAAAGDVAAAPAAAGDTESSSKKAEKKAVKAAAKAEKQKQKDDRAADLAAKRKAAEESATDMYGILPRVQSQERTGKAERFVKIETLDGAMVGQRVEFRARVQKVIPAGSKMCFLHLRQRCATVQAIVRADGDIPAAMVKFVQRLTIESIVDVSGLLVAAEITGAWCTQKTVELSFDKLFTVSAAVPQLPLQLDDAARSEKMEKEMGKVNQDTSLDHRVVDVRTMANQAIFKMQSGVCRFFREFLHSQGFQEIHTPKMISAASEGGSEVFKLNYFKESAFLAQSPQLYKQMTINSDFDRVFEIGPVFRAEDSNTHRHLCEFTGLDLEMTIVEHYHEVLDMMDRLFVHIFTELQANYDKEIGLVNQQFEREPFQFLVPSLRIDWQDGIKMLQEDGVEIGLFEDLSTTQEKRLGALVKAKYSTDFYILDKFPLHIRPFYTMPDPANPEYSNSYDFMMRGEEIMSGAQRVHDPELLRARAREHQVDFSTVQSYLDSFDYGAWPHGGGGVGMERVVMLFLGLPNIRKTSLFPRDPKRLIP
eukprot:m.102654 g.102654  ORF g.102654 m.102654 type:complete len:608 (-) comp20829_c0_seq1:65-1888(-)